jgi:hypothetical protein
MKFRCVPLNFHARLTDTDAPKATASQRLALDLLRLDSLTVVVPGDAAYPLAERVEVVGLQALVRRETGAEAADAT